MTVLVDSSELMSEVREALSKRVAKLRGDYGLTQFALGEKIGRSQGNIADVEKRRRGVSLDILVELSKFFEVSVDYLLGVTDEPDPYGSQEEQVVKRVADPTARAKLQAICNFAVANKMSADDLSLLLLLAEKIKGTPPEPESISPEQVDMLLEKFEAVGGREVARELFDLLESLLPNSFRRRRRRKGDNSDKPLNND